jgi:hypothetical protein
MPLYFVSSFFGAPIATLQHSVSAPFLATSCAVAVPASGNSGVVRVAPLPITRGLVFAYCRSVGTQSNVAFFANTPSDPSEFCVVTTSPSNLAGFGSTLAVLIL